MSLVPNAFLGLWEGPIDNKANSVINAVFNNPELVFVLLMGTPVYLKQPPNPQLLPNIDTINDLTKVPLFYGICVGGDEGGIYPQAGDGFLPAITPENTVAASFNKNGAKICTQGRCVSRMVAIDSEINVGDPLAVSFTAEALQVATSGDFVVARALQFVAKKTTEFQESFAAVDIQREGKL